MQNPSPPSNRTQLGAAAASAAAAPSALDELERLRDLIAENDRESVRLLNRRLELVAEVWREKEANGLPQLDREREDRLLQQLAASNEGPLSEDGLAAFHAALLSLTKRELGR